MKIMSLYKVLCGMGQVQPCMVRQSHNKSDDKFKKLYLMNCISAVYEMYFVYDHNWKGD